MNCALLAVAALSSASSLVLLDSAVKATALLALAAAAAMILRRDSAATRYLVWLLAIVAVLAVPALSAILPEWQVLPDWASIQPAVAAATSPPPIARPADDAAQLPPNISPKEVEQASAPAHQPVAGQPVSPPTLAAPEISPEPAVWSWNWLDAFPLVWAAGFCVLVLRLVAARWMLWNTERQGTVLSSLGQTGKATRDPIVTAFQAVCSQLGISRPVTLLMHPDETIPAVWGILRSRLLLPATARHWSSEQLQSVLLHELAHIKRRDMMGQLLAQIAGALHWFNPLAWFAARRLGVECERACDDLALAGGVRPSAYAEHLLDVASRLSPVRWTKACGLVMACKPSLKGRLDAVLSGNVSRRKVSLALATIALAVTVAIAIPIAMLRAAEEKPGEEPKPAATDMQPKGREKLDPGTEERLRWGQPAAGLRAAIAIRPAPGKPKPGDFSDLYLVVQNVSDAPIRLNDTAAAPKLREVYLKHDGRTLSGVVSQDPTGTDAMLQPREVAFLLIFPRDVKRADRRTAGSIMAEDLLKDSHLTMVGELQIEHAPAGAWTGNLRTGETSGEVAADKPAPLSPRRRQTTTLVQGLPLEGTVTDRDGKPIARAWVGQGEDRCRPYTVETRTDPQGRYRFAHCEPGPLMLTAVAPGHSPELREVTVAKDMKPVDFRLAPGKTLRLRVVDTAGRPIAGAGAGPDTWRGHRTLHFLGLPQKTDAQGRWVWDGAPADAMLCYVYCKGYMSCRNRSLVATDDEHAIVLHPALVVSGRVSDAATGKPVPEFSVLPGCESDTPRPRSLSWDHVRTAMIGKEGHYSITITEPAEKRLIRIDSPGYVPAISRAIGNDEGNVTINFDLKKTARVAVLTPQGKPAAGATVAICTPQAGAFISDGVPSPYRERTTTDTEGRFSIAPQDSVFFLLIFHSSGFTYVTHEQWKRAEPIRLDPWARVEGVCRVHGKPAPEQHIRLDYSRESERNTPNVICSYKAITDKQGRFTFERVIPGHGHVTRLIDGARRGTSWSWIPADLTKAVFVAGQTTHVEIARRGRPIVGRFSLPKAAEITPDWWYSRLSVRSIAPGRHSPKAGVSFSVTVEWTGPFKSKIARGPHSPEPDVSFGGKVESDGSFRIEDVPAGDYQLTVRLDAPVESGRAAKTKMIGSTSHSFHVPEMPDGYSDEPLELGTLELSAEAGELILRAVDMDTGKAIPGVTFAIENGSAEVWAVEVGKADADGVLRLKAQKRPGYYYMVWQKPKDYKVAGFDDAYISIVPGGKVGYDFKLRKMPSARSFPSLVPLPPGHQGRIPPPRRLENNIHWASTVEDMPGFGRKRVTFWFYPDKQGRVPTKRLQLAERIFHNGPRIAAAVRDELKYFQKAVPEDRGDIENMQEILIELGGSNSAGEVNNNWRFWCRVPGGMPLLQHGYRIGFTDLESWDLEVPFYLQPAPAGH